MEGITTNVQQEEEDYSQSEEKGVPQGHRRGYEFHLGPMEANQMGQNKSHLLKELPKMPPL